MPLIHGPRIGLSGKYKFEVLHPDTRKPIVGRDGVPIYRDASGFVRRAGVWQPNLITDRGLDEFHENRILTMSSGSMRRFLKVGTGSAAPAVTDAALAAYVGESDDSGTGNGVYTHGYDETGDPLFRFSSVRVVEFTAGGSLTLTEFGFDPSTGDFTSIRELLRDEVGDPTSVALTSGQMLSVSHEAFMEIPEATTVSFDVVEKNLAGTTVGTQSYTGVLYAIMQFESGSYMPYMEPGNIDASTFEDTIFQSTRTAKTTLGVGTGTHIDIDAANDRRGNNLGAAVHASYTPGDHYLDLPLVLEPSDQLPGDAPVRSFGTGYLSSNDLDAGYWIALDVGQAIPKASTHSLALNLRLSWARA